MYIEHRKSDDQTSIWSKYTTAKDGQTAKCNICSAILKTTGGSTTGLHTHLLKIHSTKVKKAKQKGKVTSELKQLKAKGERFSISFDELTAISNKRLLNVIIHSAHKICSLGLVRIHESLKAEICVQRVKKRLQNFGIDLELDIIAVVTDGPNVIRKMGTLIKAEHQLCFAHAIHLAVCNVLYKKKYTGRSTKPFRFC